MNKRIISILMLFSMFLSGTVGRVGYIMFSGNYTASSSYNSYALKLDKIYPTIYDRNMKLLTNNKKRMVAVIRPNEKCLSELENLFNFNEIKSINEELSKGYPVTMEINNYYPCNSIQIFEAVKRNSNNSNILLKSALMHFNEPVGEKNINFAVDARGRLLDGDEGEVFENNYNTNEGVVLTIDDNIQKIVEYASKEMKKGAVVVLDANNNEILASVSKPNDNINRVLSPYPVGSVFKLVVAAAALENEIELNYSCEGSVTIGDTVFSCQKNKIHGNQNMKTALANSCNCYFIKLALTLGAERLLNTAKKLGFNNKTVFCENWEVKNGNLPDKNMLSSKGQLSLFGFGQGSLTSTPLQFASVISAFSNGGHYTAPTLVSAYVDENGTVMDADVNKTSKVFESEVAKEIKNFMRYVVTNGTGKSAEYNNNSAGKTSTAQTGNFVGEKEILDTWFAGFYPFDKPKYVIAVVTEDGISGSADCCPIFRTIVEMLENK